MGITKLVVDYEELSKGDVFSTFFDRIFVVNKITNSFIYCNRLYDGSNAGSKHLTLYLTEMFTQRHELFYVGTKNELILEKPELFI